jgi:hypothetical protein
MTMANFTYFLKYRLNPARWIPATILCIRFPFLYPRNRFSGKHYTNWVLGAKKMEAHEKAYRVVGEIMNKENPLRSEKISNWWAFVEKFYSLLESFLGIFHIIPSYTELGALPSGWRKAFGLQICRELKRALLADGGWKRLRMYRIEQIKEKFGELCWYDHGGNEETNNIIAKYTYISRHTCITCGKSANYVTKGWVEPYCREHLPDWIDPDNEDQVYTYYTKEFPFYGVYSIKFKDKEDKTDETGPGSN